LKHWLTAYQNVTPFQILEHLNNHWCPLDVKAKKALKDAYYTKWDGDEHLTAFGKCLNDDQRALIRSDVMIADEDKLQFYLKQMYDSNHFDKNNMLEWEKQPNATKTDYNSAKDYFEALGKATKTCEQNARGGTAGCNKYKLANQLADYGTKSVSTLPKLQVRQLVQPTPTQQQTSSKQWWHRSKHSLAQLHSLQQQRITPTQMPADAMEAATTRADANKRKRYRTLGAIVTPMAFTQLVPTMTA
jgi:hypothetical protein